MSHNKCYGCGLDLTNKRQRFDWLIARGMNPKDAAAQVLHAPGGLMPISSCCIVNLETNVDVDKEVRARQEIKDEIVQDQMEARINQGLAPITREIVQVFSSNLEGTAAGRFILHDFPYGDENVELLAGNIVNKDTGKRQGGFEITNIAYVPDEIAKDHGWTKKPIALWSGNIKIVPVISDGSSIVPGVLRVITTNGPREGTIIDTVDKTFLGAQIIHYGIRPIEVRTGGPSQDFHVITIMKKLPEEIIA